MNLLAHALIACSTLPDTSGQECTGALMADYFTGGDAGALSPALRRGFLQHRAVDAFTDSHPRVAALRIALAGAGAPHLTSGIVADILLDYALASDWGAWGEPLCGESLEAFERQVYGRLALTRRWHGAVFSSAYRAMVADSWLSSYATADGIRMTLAGLSSRMSGTPDLVGVADGLAHLEGRLRASFAAFWPELMGFARLWARDNGP